MFSEPGAKRQKISTDADDTELAELLLGLSNSPRSSPRNSNVSSKDFQRLSPPSCLEVVSKTEDPQSARRSQRVGKQLSKLKSTDSDDDASDVAELEHAEVSPPMKQQVAVKELPARCKCGKRVSASHPPCKSELMLLSEKFRDRFASASSDCRIDLNECALALGVPRRRLYDITIVYEAAEVVRRTGKLAYVWQGLSHLPELIERLRREEVLGEPVGDRKGNVPCHVPETTHSLWALSRKFIRLLLTHKGAIQLSDAAAHLIGQKQGTRPQTYLTVERRLYDIGSILSTLDLIKRTYTEGKRQPSFSWDWARSGEQTSGSMAGTKEGPPQLLPNNPFWADGGFDLSHRDQGQQLSSPLPSAFLSLRCHQPGSLPDWQPSESQAQQHTQAWRAGRTSLWSPSQIPQCLWQPILPAPGVTQFPPALYQASLVQFLQHCGASHGQSRPAVGP